MAYSKDGGRPRGPKGGYGGSRPPYKGGGERRNKEGGPADDTRPRYDKDRRPSYLSKQGSYSSKQEGYSGKQEGSSGRQEGYSGKKEGYGGRRRDDTSSSDWREKNSRRDYEKSREYAPRRDESPQGRDEKREYGKPREYAPRRDEKPQSRDGRREYGQPRTYTPRYDEKPQGRDGRRQGYDDVQREAPRQIEQQEQTLPYFLMGRNAVREAVKNGRSIDRILVVPEQDGSLREILTMARARGLVVRETDRKKLDEMCLPFGHNGKPGNHQGILALVPDIEYVELQDILAFAREKGEEPFLLLLDEINDPHNLGSMLRSAACAGAHGVVIKKRRSASVTAAVAKISAGAVEYVKVAKVTNLTTAIEALKKEGVWIAGADQGGTPMAEAKLKGALALVIGNEGEGLSRLVKERCDFLVSVPMRGEMDSLNASVAAAVLLFEKNRQEEAHEPNRRG